MTTRPNHVANHVATGPTCDAPDANRPLSFGALLQAGASAKVPHEIRALSSERADVQHVGMHLEGRQTRLERRNSWEEEREVRLQQ